MAQTLDDCEFWLPPQFQFLTDDDMLMEKRSGVKGFKDVFGTENDTSKGFLRRDISYGFGPFGFASDLSSPNESVVGSTETESDEEDFIAGLTRKMAQSTFEDISKKTNSGFASENAKAWVSSGSPQSTLCAVGSGCGCRQGSSRGSPNGPSHGSSPPATWDLLYAAAGEVARMRMSEEGYGGYHHHQQNKGLLGPQRKPTPISVPLKNPAIDVNFYSNQNQSISHQQLQATQQQMMKQQSQAVWAAQMKSTGNHQQHHQAHQMVLQNRARNAEIVANRNSRQVGLSLSAWPPLQQQQQQTQQNGSGMRAVFLGTPGAKKECAGTGVFLPRRAGYPPETRKKPACSTALLPARVVQALNLNLDGMGGGGGGGAPSPQIQPRFNGGFVSDNDMAQRLRSSSNNNNIMLQQYQQKRNNIRPQPVINHHEIRLPQEWTY